MGNLNGITKAAINANATRGFAEFVEKISVYPIGCEVTVSNVLGSTIWDSLERSDKITLGKAVKANVDCGNLTGIEPVQTRDGQNQKYKRIGKVEMLTFFACDYWGMADNIENLLKLNQERKDFAFIQCYYETDNANEKVILNCKGMDVLGNTIFEAEPFEKPFSFFENHGFSRRTSECKAILSLWYGFDRVFEERNKLIRKGIANICFMAPNDQMMQRIAGIKFNTKASAYDYTEFIQKNFIQFKKGEIRELPFGKGIISFRNINLK